MTKYNFSVPQWSNIPLWTKILIGLFIFILFFILNFVISHSINYKWWNSFDGKKYNDLFSLTTFLLANYNLFTYGIARLFFNTVMSDLNRTQITFIKNNLMIYMKVPGGADKSFDIINDFFVPRHLCDNILFTTGEDPTFDKWVIENKRDPSIVLEYDENGKPKNNGVYPGIFDRVGWEHTFTSWGCGNWSKHPGSEISMPFYDEKNKKFDEDTTKYIKEWFDKEKHPDNVFARYGIRPDSYLVISYVNNKYNDQGMELDPEALKVLMGGHAYGSQGGWLGFITGVDSEKGSDSLANILYGSYGPNTTGGTGSNAGKNCNAYGSISAGLSTGGLGLMTGPAAPIVTPLLALGGFFLDRASKKCPPFS